MKWLGLISQKLNYLGGAISGIFILFLGLIVTYEVIMRYFFRSPTDWVNEIASMLCLGSAFLALGYVMQEKAHIDVDFITKRLSKRNQILFSLIGLILSAIYCALLIWTGTEVAFATFRAGEMNPLGLGIPTFILRGFVPAGGIFLLVEIINQVLEKGLQLKKVTSASNETFFRKNLPSLIFMLPSKELAPIGLLILLFVTIFGGVPVAFALGLLGVAGLYFTFGGGPMLYHVPMVSFNILTDFIMVALPLFIMVSNVLSIGGIGQDLFEAASSWVRHLPGGLGVATLLACAIFAAISGSSTATVATIGMIALPAMLSKGYSRKITYGIVAMGGVLGPLIPPSMFMILIGSMTGDSIGKLFMAGMLPGIMLAVIFSIYILLHASNKKSGMPKLDPASWKERLGLIRKAIWGLLTPLVILGGRDTGVFTPTEAAAIGVTYGLFICLVIYRTLSVKKSWRIILEGAKFNAMILFLVSGAMVFGQVVALLQLPDVAFKFLTGIPLSPMGVLFLVLLFIVILGALMDEASILLVTYPSLYHIFVKGFGFDSIWFAMVFVFTLEVGLVLPPVGINLFVVQGLDRTARFEEVVKGVVPFIILMIASIFIVVYFKPLSTWLPKLIG
jgi:C4-dicarboxylate transporter, DctM subunit